MANRISGLISGMDTDSVIQKMITTQKARLVDTYLQKNQVIKWKQESYRETNTKLLALRNAAFDLKLDSSFQAKKVESNNTYVSATGNSSAIEGTYSLEVISIAKGATKESSPIGGYVHNGNDRSFDLTGEFGTATITVKDGQTLHDVVKSINAVSSKTGIRAIYDEDNGKFYLNSTKTGSQAKVHFNDTNNFMKNILKMDQSGALGTDAKVKFNDGAEQIFSSNSFTINGISFNVRKAGETAHVTVKNDVDTAFNKIKAFVEAYNNVVTFMDSKINEKRYSDYAPLTDEQKESMKEKDIELWEEKAKSGMMKADSMYSSIYNNLRMATMDTVPGLSSDNPYKSLMALGIKTSSWMDQGKLYIDEARLKEALETNPEAVQELFMKTDDDGVNIGLSAKIYDNITESMKKITDKAGSDITSVDFSYLGQEVERNNEIIARGEERLQQMADRYYAQFAAMEQLMARIEAQSTWLTQQLSSITGAQ